MNLKSRVDRLLAKASVLIEPPGITPEERAKVERRLEYLLAHPAELEIVIEGSGPASDFLRARMKL